MQKKTLIKNIFKLIVVFILFNESYLFQYIPIIIFRLDVKKLTMSNNVLLNIFANICLLIILILMYRKELRKDFKKFKKDIVSNLNVGFNYWTVGLFIMIVSNVIINLVFKTGGAGNEQAVQKMISTLPFMMLIDAAFIAPINEEIVFRKTLMDIFKNKYVFSFLSFLIFGLVHVIGNVSSWADYLYIIPYGAMGLTFALADYKTDTIFTSICMHMFHNFALTLISII